MSSKKIIYLSWSRLSDRIFKDYYIEGLINEGFLVEYWDLISLLREEHVDAGEFSPEFLRIFKDYAEFEFALKENSNQIFWLLVDYNRISRRLFHILNKYGVKCISIQEASRPLFLTKKSFFKKICTYLLNPKKLYLMALDFLVYKYDKFFLKVSPTDIVFKTGSASRLPDWHAKKVVRINSIDYQKYKISSQSSKKILNYKYAIFLDSCVPFHNDHKILNRKTVNPKNYYCKLNHFFDQFENKYNLKVIISAHPSAIYEENPFGGRSIFRMLTSDLTKNAEIAFGDASLSMAYAVLYRKPIVLVVSNEILKLYHNDGWMRVFNSYHLFLKSPVVNVDKFDLNSFGDIFHIKEAVYKSYEEQFLVNDDTRGIDNIDIVKKNLHSLMVA